MDVDFNPIKSSVGNNSALFGSTKVNNNLSEISRGFNSLNSLEHDMSQAKLEIRSRKHRKSWANGSCSDSNSSDSYEDDFTFKKEESSEQIDLGHDLNPKEIKGIFKKIKS